MKIRHATENIAAQRESLLASNMPLASDQVRSECSTAIHRTMTITHGSMMSFDTKSLRLRGVEAHYRSPGQAPAMTRRVSAYELDIP
jgi:hypothetical protein